MNANRRDEYTAAAIELLDRHGPATQTLGITASEVCEVASFHRSTLYRHFETITEMNDAVAIWLAVTDGDWRTRLCDVDPGLPLRTALHLALGQPSDPASMWMRGVVASWNPDHPARHAVTRIEEGRQRRFQDWLHTHLRQKGLRPVRGMTLTALATGIAAQVEGEGMLRFIDLPSPEHHVEPRESLVAAVLHLVQELSEPGTPGTREITAEAGDLDLPIEASMQRRLRALTPQLLDRRPEPTRLVNVGRLARRLGVQERRLYAMWPTALDMNVDLARAVLRRERDRLDDLLAYLFESTAEQPVASLVEVLARCGHRAVAGPGSSGGNCFALMGGLLSPEHRVPLAEQFDGWAADLRTSFLAGQALTRWYRRPGVSPNDLARSLRWTCFGLQRLARSHPALLEQTVDYDGSELSMVGSLPIFAARSLSTPHPPSVGWASEERALATTG